MRLPDVISELNDLGRRLRMLEREFEFHHSQFRQALFHVKHLAQALDTADWDHPVRPAAATLVAACDNLLEVIDGSQATE